MAPGLWIEARQGRSVPSATVTLFKPLVAMVNHSIVLHLLAGGGDCCFCFLFYLMLIFSNSSYFIFYVEMSVMVHSGVVNRDSSF